MFISLTEDHFAKILLAFMFSELCAKMFQREIHLKAIFKQIQ